MHGLYELKEMLCKELEEYGSKEMTAGSLEVVDKLAHAIKNIDRIIENYEEKDGYSERGSSYRRGYSRDGGRMSNRGGSYDGGSSNRGGSYDGGSYARGRGRNAKRDSMGRYSRDGYSRDDGQDDMIQQLEELMEQAPNQQVKQRIEQLVNELENA